MNILTVIPARGGSKRLPNKNIRPLLGHPLIWWAIQAAKDAKLGPIVVSTDAIEIGQRCIGCSVLLRPKELAQDDTPTLPVLAHAWRWGTAFLGQFDWVLCLQPTSPLRHSHDIRCALDLAVMGGAEASSVISVTALEPLGTAGGARFKTNGAIYLIRADDLLKGRLYGPYPRLYYMAPDRSIDIDTLEDFQACERILHQREVADWRAA